MAETVGIARERYDRERATCEQHAERLKDAVYAEDRVRATIIATSMPDFIARWQAADDLLNSALSRATTAVPYA